MANRPLFFHAGIQSLEDSMIKSIVTRHGLEIFDIEHWLAGYTEDELDRTMGAYVLGTDNYMLPNVPLDRLTGKPYMRAITVLKPGIPDDMSVLAQVCALIGHQSTRYENLVSAFFHGYIDALRATGATEEEVKQIAFRDRLARGGTMQDEATAVELLHSKHAFISYEPFPTHQFTEIQPDGPLLSATVRRCLIDYAFIGKSPNHTLASVLFKVLDKTGALIALRGYTNRTRCIYAATKVAQRLGYNLSNTEDERTGKHVLDIFGKSYGDPIQNISECFSDPNDAIEQFKV